MKIGDLELGEYLLDALFIIPCLEQVHLQQKLVEAGLIVRGKHLLVACNQFHRFVVGAEAGFEHRQLRIILRRLFEVSKSDVVAKYHPSFVVTFLSPDDVQQGGLSRSIAGNQSDLIPLGNAKRDIAKEQQIAEAFGECVDLQEGMGHIYLDLASKVQKTIDSELPSHIEIEIGPVVTVYQFCATTDGIAVEVAGMGCFQREGERSRDLIFG